MFLVLAITLFCSLSITTAASRTTWAFSRDNAVPGSTLWARVNPTLGVPVWSLALLTLVQALLGLINLGSTSAFVAFTSAGVVGLAVSYGMPIAISLLHGRREVSRAAWSCRGPLGWCVNLLGVAWIAFELVLFSMPTALPVTAVSMNYASVVVVGFFVASLGWYWVYARRREWMPLTFLPSLVFAVGRCGVGWCRGAVADVSSRVLQITRARPLPTG